VLVAAAISRYASALDGLARGLDADVAFRAIVDRDLETGRHVNESGRIDWFTTAYFHRPDELRGEVAAAGLAVVEVVGLEGPAWLLADLPERWDDPERRARLLALLGRLEAAPELLGASAHLLCVARRPDL
jgi:hypothetical protein